MVELDGKREERVRDPMELVALVVVGVVAAFAVAPQLGPEPSPTVIATPPARPAAAPRAAASLAPRFALSAQPLAAGDCGAFSATNPPPSISGGARALRRIDVDVSVTADPGWRWCVAGARIYDDGIELVGRFADVRYAPNEDRPPSVLHSATLSAQLAGFGGLAPSEFVRTSGGFALLRLRAATDNGRRSVFLTAADRASALTLRLVAVAGPWTFVPVPIADGPLDVTADAHGVRFRLHDLKLLPDGIATTPYTAIDSPDPAVVMLEWQAADDRGTVYRPRPDVAIDGMLPGLYRAFEPAPPADATSLELSIRRVHLTPLRDFAVSLPLQP